MKQFYLFILFFSLFVSMSIEVSSSEELSIQFLNDIKKEIDNAVGVNEKIKTIEIKDKKIYVQIDITKTDPTPLTVIDLAFSRNSSVTDKILQLSKIKNCDHLWNVIIVDFHKIGKIINKKSDMQENQYGGRYFPSNKFRLITRLSDLKTA